MRVTIILGVLLATSNAGSIPAIKPWPKEVLPAAADMPENRIIGGQPAQEGQFPYQVGLSVSNSPGYSAWCGGSLISTEWVLTAAHCTYQMTTATVYLGATNRTDAQQIITSSELYVHPSYDASIISDDISLIKLPVMAKITNLVKPVALPSISCSYSTYLAQSVIASGWGKTSDNSTDVAEYLSYIVRTVNPNSDCELVYGSNVVKGSNLCVGTSACDGNQSTCNGDSGGPLVLNESTPIQIGLVSYGAASGCERGYPIVFTRVTSYLGWINDTAGISS